jgi:small membrane protein
VIFSILLTVFLFGLFVYALLQKKQFPLVGRLLPLVALLGIYVAWFPNQTSKWANMVGIGRGVDLMLYVWIMASGLLFLVLHLKLVAQQRMLTELVRAVALQHVRTPVEPPRDG